MHDVSAEVEDERLKYEDEMILVRRDRIEALVDNLKTMKETQGKILDLLISYWSYILEDNPHWEY